MPRRCQFPLHFNGRHPPTRPASGGETVSWEGAGLTGRDEGGDELGLFDLGPNRRFDYRTRQFRSGLLRVRGAKPLATKLRLTFERFPETCGIYAGTFDDPAWFFISPDNARHIFLEEARPGTVIPAGFDTFKQYAMRDRSG